MATADFSNPSALSEDVEREFDSSSDRGAAIVSASYLELTLRALLEGFFFEDQTTFSSLFDDPNAPLSSFSAKIGLAYAVGLLSESERVNLDIVRRIRNEFAHELGEVSFNTQSIADRTANLEVPHGLYMPNSLPVPEDLVDDGRTWDLTPPAKTDTKNYFRAAVETLAGNLAARLSEIGPDHRRPPDKYESFPERERKASAGRSKSRGRLRDLQEERLTLLKDRAETVADESSPEYSDLRSQIDELERELAEPQTPTMLDALDRVLDLMVPIVERSLASPKSGE